MRAQRRVRRPQWLDLAALRAVDVTDTAWKTQVICGGLTDVFFPEPCNNNGQYDYSEAAEVCARCPVKLPCLATWLATVPEKRDKPYVGGGYVGGADPFQRAAIRRILYGKAAA